MSIEITRRCPLSCPGCYAYQDYHLAEAGSLANAQEFEGEKLIKRVLSLVDLHKPLHLSIVGGEPLVRQREITGLLPELERRRIHTQIVTSAVSLIPTAWRHKRQLTLVVSVDGLQAEHDRRRAPATYDRILRNISGHAITVHCTVTRQMTHKPGHLEKFLRFWSKQPEVRKIWISLYTPQAGERSSEMLPPKVREQVIDELSLLKDRFRKLELPPGALGAYRRPPADPTCCVFARTTQTFSADLSSRMTPCQLGGRPDCHQCGCIAAAGLEAVSRHLL
jgi:sulfatase maturation enzyme AslB (radical SAM superfamily)